MSTVWKSAACGIAIKMDIQCHENLVVDTLKLQLALRTIIHSIIRWVQLLAMSVVKSSGIVISQRTVCRWLHESNLYSRWQSVFVPLMSFLDHIHWTPQQPYCSPISPDSVNNYSDKFISGETHDLYLKLTISLKGTAAIILVSWFGQGY